MSAKAISEYDGKLLLNRWIQMSPSAVSSSSTNSATGPIDANNLSFKSANQLARIQLTPVQGDESSSALEIQKQYQQQLGSLFDSLEQNHPWLLQTQLVVKPDQLIKRRGKLGLLGVNFTWEQVKEWVKQKAGLVIRIPTSGSANDTDESSMVEGRLTCFLVEPFVKHAQDTEHYVCIQSNREGDVILFHDQGGVDVGDVDSKAKRLAIPTNDCFDESTSEGKKLSNCLRDDLLAAVPSGPKKHALESFLKKLFAVYVDLNFTYLEINPLVVMPEEDGSDKWKVVYLDLAAKIDQTSDFECGQYWTEALNAVPLPPSFPPKYVSAPSEAGVSKAPLRHLSFPAPFGRELGKEEAYIAELDGKTGASLKLTLLNRNGRIWTMVAGGGASVVYSDAIAAHGFAHELANYGEYSGAPSETQTYEYAKTLLSVMTSTPVHPHGKILLIGGGIANFTNVASTFKGIVRALREFSHKLQSQNVKIYVRRGGPNYQEGLKTMREVGETLGVPIYVFGPETHITAIVPMALGLVDDIGGDEVSGGSAVRRTSSSSSFAEQLLMGQVGGVDGYTGPTSPEISVAQSKSVNGKASPGSSAPSNSPPQQVDQPLPQPKSNVKKPSGIEGKPLMTEPELVRHSEADHIAHFPSSPAVSRPWYQPFSDHTRSFVYGMQPRAVQGMLDFDQMCKRDNPSVAAMIYPFGGNHVQKFYWGDKETLLPVVNNIADAVQKYPEVDCVVNFASFRSVYDSTMELMNFPQIKTIAIIAEGVPERRARQILKKAKEMGVLIIGPATVGGIKPGCFKIGNTAGMIDNIISSKLYRSGSVGYVSKSGGMSNELNNLLARWTDGVYEGVAIGGDRYPGSTFLDHLLRFQDDPQCKMLMLLGEVGGVEEYKVAEAIKTGRITKPVVAWCIGTCAGMFGTEVQFGHAGALANSNSETAEAKNQALKAAGAIVPPTFEELPKALSETYKKLVEAGNVVPRSEPPVPKIPIDYAWAQELGLIRKPASFVSTICDDRGQELLYAGMPISKVFEEDIGIGGVLSLLWFKRRLPQYASKFIEMILMLTADHGPAVSGAHNTIVTARAGKDVISSLCAGLLTIGDRFGGALDGAAEIFSSAYDKGLSPQEFVSTMRKNKKLIPGIGHKIKSRNNPDLRVTILTDYAKKTFPQTPLLDFAREVEKITTSKKDNLILNVDGAIAVLFVDLLRHSGAFSLEEAEEYLKIGVLNGLFVVGRSIGFVGHFVDQKRLKQGLYRHPWDDISYIVGMDGSGENKSVLVDGSSLARTG